MRDIYNLQIWDFNFIDVNIYYSFFFSFCDMDFCYPHPLYKFLVSLNLTHYLLGGRILHSYMCVPNVGPLGRTRLGFITYLYGKLGFPRLGSSLQSDSMKSLFSLSLLFTLYLFGNLSTTFFFLQLLIFIAT